MTLLAAIAMLCCCVVPLLAVVLALQVRRTVRSGAEPEHVADAGFEVRLPVVMHTHPRLDLAVGFVPAGQSVDRTRRQHRSAAPSTRPRRLDLVYARAEMGDLSDPDTRRAGPFSSHSRATRADVVGR